MKVIGTATSRMRGIVYFTTGAGGTGRLNFPLQGSVDCPQLPGEAPITASLAEGVFCGYVMGTLCVLMAYNRQNAPSVL